MEATDSRVRGIESKQDFIGDVLAGLSVAPMAVRLTPHLLSVIDWNNPLNDPVRRQFIPLKSTTVPDHPKLSLDPLHERGDSRKYQSLGILKIFDPTRYESNLKIIKSLMI